jgi:hypothetical protein
MTTLLEEPRELEAEFLEGFATIHQAMRRDTARLPRAVARAGSADEWAALRRWFDRFEQTIVHHHEREDTIVWGELVARDPGFGAELDQLEADHHALDEAMSAVRAALWRQDWHLAIDAADVLAELLHDHLDREEAAAFPRLARTFTAEQYGEIEQRLQQGTPFSHLSFEVAWALDGVEPERLAALLATVPVPLRILYRVWFRPAYARIAKPLREVAR